MMPSTYPGRCMRGRSPVSVSDSADARKPLQGTALAIDSDVRGRLGNFGLKLAPVGAVKSDARNRE